MLLIILGLAVGAIFGSVFLDYQGWELGAVIGALAGMVLQQMQKIGALESAIKLLKTDQLKISQQIAQLKNDIPGAQSTLNKTPAPLLQPVAAEKAGVSEVESLDLDLPPLDAAELKKPAQTTPPPAFKLSTPKPTLPSTPPPPSAIDKLGLAVRRFFTEGNPIVRIGMVVMFFGVSFLVKYASSQGLLPIELRLTGVLIVAIALIGFGWKTRSRPGGYGLVLQGGGIAVIYLTLFAAARIYGLIPLGAAFGLLFLVVILGVLLALLQNAQVLAILATAGGFVAPILTSTGEGSHIGLFSFYLILNIGILAIAVYKAWRLLNWVGFMFTFVITAAWGVLKYEPAFYATTQPFLAAFFVLYLGVAILFSFKQTTNVKGMVDGSLVFGLPLVAFGLQTALLKHTDHGVAISAVVLAVIYLALATVMGRRYLSTHRVLIESFLALGISFATLAVPLALDASWTSVTWALEATGLVWVGLRQQRLRPRFVGYLLHCAAAFSLVVVNGLDTGSTAVITGDFLGLVLLALSSLIIAYLLLRFDSVARGFEKFVGIVAMVAGLLWWFIANLMEIGAHILAFYQFASIMLFVGVTGLCALLAAKKLNWIALQNCLFGFLPFIIFYSLATFSSRYNDAHPLQSFAPVSVLIFLAVHYWFLFKSETTAKTTLLRGWHTATAWWIFSVIFWEVAWQKDHFNLQETAGLMIWFAAIAIPVVALIGAGQKKFWPFVTFTRDYKNWVPAPLFILAALWFFGVCHKTLNQHYLPLLNPLDLAQFAIVLIFAYAAKREFMDRLSFITNSVRAAVLGVMLFVWVNVVTLRALSYYQHIDYDFDVLWDAVQVQMALSILWTLCALIVMNLSRRVARRELWVVGAGLLGLVVLKLFTKDLTGSGTLARIVSFMVVGGLMLAIGFLSPIPEKSKSPDEPAEETKTDNSPKDATHG